MARMPSHESRDRIVAQTNGRSNASARSKSGQFIQAGLIGLAFGFGILFGASSIPLWVDQSNQQLGSALLEQGQRIEEQFQLVLKQAEMATTGAEGFSPQSHRGTLILSQGVPSSIENFNSVSTYAGAPDLGLEDRILSSLKANYKTGDVRLQGYFIGAFAMNESKSQESIVLVKPLASDPNRANFSVIDPVKALQHFNRFDKTPAALIDKTGRVLAHSSKTLNGINLSLDKSLQKTISSLFDSARFYQTGERKNLDQDNLRYAVVKAGTTGFAIVIEQKISPFAAIWKSSNAKSSVALALLSIFGVVVLMMTAAKSRREPATNSTVRSENRIQPAPAPAVMPVASSPFKIQPQNQIQPVFQAANTWVAPTPVSSAVSQSSAFSQSLERMVPQPVQSAVANLAEVRKAVTQETEKQNVTMAAVKTTAAKQSTGKDSVVETQNALSKAKSESDAERIMSAMVSDLVDSPVLYFRYNTSTHQFQMTHSLGIDKMNESIKAPISVRPDIEASVLSLANQGKAAALTNYAPIQKAMIEGVNTAHFEAWAVTSGAEMNKRGSTLIGLLVIQHSGFKSAEERPVLARILRLAANTIYGQRNKIRPRTDATRPGANP